MLEQYVYFHGARRQCRQQRHLPHLTQQPRQQQCRLGHLALQQWELWVSKQCDFRLSSSGMDSAYRTRLQDYEISRSWNKGRISSNTSARIR